MKDEFRYLSAFDLDGTLIKGNISVHFGLYLAQKKLISKWILTRLFFVYISHLMGIVSLDSLHKKSCNALFKGLPLKTLNDWVEVFLDERLDQLHHPVGMKEFTQARVEGHYLALYSSSPDFLVSAVGKRLLFHHAQGVMWQVGDHGCIDSVAKIFSGKEKAQALKFLSDSLSIPKEKTIAYSDSIQDLPFMQSAGIAIAVAPSRKFKKICKSLGWKIL